MVSQVTEYAVLAFLAFVSMAVLYFIYLGIMGTQLTVKEQVNSGEYKSQCNCLVAISVLDNKIIVRNMGCETVNNLAILWPDYEYLHNGTLYENDLVEIYHNSSYKNDYSFQYNECE